MKLDTRRLIRHFVDIVAMVAVGVFTTLAYGLWYGLFAVIALGIYSCWCFTDGITSK